MILRSLDLEALKATPVTRQPFEYFVVPGFVRPDARAKINADYPKISEGGSFPVAQLSYGPAFREFLEELESDEFRDVFEEKFGLDLAGSSGKTLIDRVVLDRRGARRQQGGTRNDAPSANPTL